MERDGVRDGLGGKGWGWDGLGGKGWGWMERG